MYHITIKSGNYIRNFRILSNYLLKDLKKKISDMEMIPNEKIRFIYNNEILSDDMTFDELNIPNKSVILLDIKLYKLFLSAYRSPALSIYAEEGATKEDLLDRLKIFDVSFIEKSDDYVVCANDYITYS